MDCEDRSTMQRNNVNAVFISSLIYRAQKRLNNKVIAVNNILKRVCKSDWLEFIDYNNISAENLFEDGLRLNDDSKIILANDFTYVLNRFIL